jgi:hypothetical protein
LRNIFAIKFERCGAASVNIFDLFVKYFGQLGQLWGIEKVGIAEPVDTELKVVTIDVLSYIGNGSHISV